MSLHLALLNLIIYYIRQADAAREQQNYNMKMKDFEKKTKKIIYLYHWMFSEWDIR